MGSGDLGTLDENPGVFIRSSGAVYSSLFIWSCYSHSVLPTGGGTEYSSKSEKTGFGANLSVERKLEHILVPANWSVKETG